MPVIILVLLVLCICAFLCVWIRVQANKEKKKYIATIADLKQQLADLKNERAQFQNATESTGTAQKTLTKLFYQLDEGIVATNAQGEILFVNPHAEKIIGTNLNYVRKPFKEVLILSNKTGTIDFSLFEKALKELEYI